MHDFSKSFHETCFCQKFGKFCLFGNSKKRDLLSTQNSQIYDREKTKHSEVSKRSKSIFLPLTSIKQGELPYFLFLCYFQKDVARQQSVQQSPKLFTRYEKVFLALVRFLECTALSVGFSEDV